MMHRWFFVAVSSLTVLGLALPGLSQSAEVADPAAFLAERAMVPFGELVEDCLEDKTAWYFLTHLSKFGAPEDRRDTVIQYAPDRGFIEVAMFGGSKTIDPARERLKSRKKSIDYAVKTCAKELGKGTKELYSIVEMTYTYVNRDENEQLRLVRWFRGRWEML